jgi:hypothetical protein
MGFLDSVSGGGQKLAGFDGKAGNHVIRGSDEVLNNQEFIANIYGARGGFVMFNGKGVRPESQLGPIFPKDEAPERASLGKLDKSEWPPGKFNGGEPEDPWRPTIELPLQHRETGDEYLYTAQTRGALMAVKDLLAQCRRVPEGHNPIIRLAVGSYKGKFGTVKKPVLTIIGKSPIEGGEESDAFGDDVPF